MARGAHDRRDGPRRRARVHRRPHPLRRAAAVGPDGQPVDRARHHDGPHRQLRLHARAGAVRRPGLPHGPVRGRRGDPEAGAAALRPVRLGDVPGVPRLDAGAPRRQRADPGRSQRGAPLRHGRRRARAGGDRRRGGGDGRRRRGGDGRRRRRRQQQPGAAPARRARRAHPVVLRRRGRDPRVRRGRAPQGRAAPVDQPGHQARGPRRRRPRLPRAPGRPLGRHGLVERLRHGHAERRQRARVHGGRARERPHDLRGRPLPAGRDPLHAQEALRRLRQLGAVGRPVEARSRRQARGAGRPDVAGGASPSSGRRRSSW